ncbi:MAG: protein kinase, partial [Phycisphaerales bacterium]|nr:protein kinase [Phycisphaerales bacterium]
MTDQPPNPAGPEDTTRRDSEAMLRGKPTQDPLVGTSVDQYSIKRVIGEGGMGVVYEALQQSPRRTVALKMMKRGVTSKSAMRRFEYEAQTLGRLRHDGIAQIYQAGTWDDGTGGRPWFAMEYIQGAKTLTRYCKDKKLGTRDRLELFSKACDAVQHGHQKGIIHRDLKPGNILVTSSGVPKVIDFGVARSTDSDLAVTTLQTDVGALIGTLQYMSPEQCDADPNDIDIRSDVYALGVVLYELLCDQPPYALRHAAIHEAARIIREEEPTKPSSVDKRLRGDIETIALKALEKDRDRRYQSATALEEDIDRYLAGDPITAKAPSAIDYLKRFARKHKAAAIAIAAIFVVLVGAVIAISSIAVELSVQRNTAESAVDKAEQLAKSEAKHRKIAQEQAHEAEQAQQHVLLAAYQSNIHAAAEALSNNSLYDVRRKLADAERMVVIQQLKAGRAGPSNGFVLEGIPQDQLPFEWQYLHARADDSIVTLRGHEDGVISVTFSPDGTRLASAGGD